MGDGLGNEQENKLTWLRNVTTFRVAACNFLLAGVKKDALRLSNDGLTLPYAINNWRADAQLCTYFASMLSYLPTGTDFSQRVKWNSLTPHPSRIPSYITDSTPNLPSRMLCQNTNSTSQSLPDILMIDIVSLDKENSRLVSFLPVTKVNQDLSLHTHNPLPHPTTRSEL